ncbi:MAG TPA: sugar ABC transporter ATP-binding protein [Aggregatilinea sp.]|uniref:sugar ABC transporter ATP-binding protein n=1 Tax=Aggregatilinea sp. TaxID=2806333 RepID=UPI002BA73E12|nr:sugar ABC transporter ATP-binding protein [Aggregatilinea sp.]HML20722.1 sugar ABC transporter ATP-binding protein [Aggregatilinea sp.]
MTSLLQASSITKQFPGTLALDNVQLDLQAGEIHAVVGENGAGKSTLMKILSGVYTPDAGTITFEGAPLTVSNPRDALTHGIAIVHQELSLVPALTVAENIYPGRLPTNALGFVKYGELFRRAAAILDSINLDISPRTPVSDLSIAKQQLVEIAKALSMDTKVLILDEPTSALTEREVEILFDLLRKLAAKGVGILYISHKLDEIFALTDRITVLRDGKYIGTVDTADVSTEDIIRMMVGRELGHMYPAKSSGERAPLLEIRDLRLPGQPMPCTFTLYAGEIVGFAGLIGSGRTELARAIFGADARAAGELRLEGKPVNIGSPSEAIKYQIGYLPEDRKAAGLFLDMSVKMNIEAANRPAVTSNGFINSAKERVLAEEYVRQLSIATAGVDQEVRRLSGGNQQKVLVAKWLAIKPKVLIVDEPTRGVDVGAKSEIHHLLRQLAETGVAVMMISSELPEILGMSDRVMVMHEGAIVAEIPGGEATEEKIMAYASGQTAGVPAV